MSRLSSHIYSDRQTDRKNSMLTKKGQSALEYMMTYGWAILIIVIVAVILYSMGIFNPASSITTTSSGFSPFAVSSVLCSQAGLTIAVTAGGLPNNANSVTLYAVYFKSNTGTTAKTDQRYNLTKVTLLPGGTAKIIVPTVACTSTGTSFSMPADIEYTYSTAGLTVNQNATGTIAGKSSGPSVSIYIPLTITSSSATPSPFQQMVTVNMSKYSSYASSNLDNIEFTYPNGTIIQSWRENGTSNNQVVNYWLKLGTFTSTTVHLDFFPTTYNAMNSVNTGEAPQLTCSNPSDTASCSTYGEYDDGVNVFNYYTNFAGTGLPSSWTTNNISDVNINNGFSIGFSPHGVELNYTRKFSSPIVLDWQGNFISNPQRYCGWTIFGWYDPPYSAGFAQWQDSPTSYVYYQYGNVSQAAPNFYNSSGLIGKTYVFSLANDVSSMHYFINYTLQTYSNPEDQSLPTILFRNGAGCGPLSGSEVNVTWLDVRSYPPNDFMPSVTFGSVS